jgi:hypothetical protein
MAVRLSAPRAGSPLPLGSSWYSFLLEAESTPEPNIPKIPRVNNSKKIRWARHVTWIWRILVRHSQKEKTHERLANGREFNTKTDLKIIGCEGVGWNHWHWIGQSGDRLWTFMFQNRCQIFKKDPTSWSWHTCAVWHAIQSFILKRLEW